MDFCGCAFLKFVQVYRVIMPPSITHLHQFANAVFVKIAELPQKVAIGIAGKFFKLPF